MLMPLEAEAVSDPGVRALEADLLAVQSATTALSLQAMPADLSEGVKLIREARMGAGVDLMRAWNSATAEQQEVFLTAIGIVQRKAIETSMARRAS